MNTQATHMKVLRKGLALTGLLAGMLLGAGSVLAHPEDMPAKPGPEMRKQFEERCKADPQKCEEIKKRMEERRAACKADPEACQKQREERRAKMEERRKAMRAECEKDPEACKQKREEMRKKFEERCKAEPQKCEQWKKDHPHRHGPGGKPMEPPPPPQAAN